MTLKSLFLFLALTISAGVLINHFQKTDHKISKMDRIDKAIEQEREMTIDPALNEVPRHRLLTAKRYKDRLSQDETEAAIPGISWTERGPNNVSGRTRAILIDAGDATNNTVFAGSVGGGLWKTTNSKATTPSWTAVNDLFGNLAVSAITQDPADDLVIYFGTGEGWFNADAVRGLGIYKSTDGGSTWNQLASTNNSTYHYTEKLVMTDGSVLLAATRNGGVRRSTDGGNTWTKVLGSGAGASTNRAADLEIASNGDIYASMGIFSTDGIYQSTDDGVSWSKLSGGLPTSGFHRIELACAPSDSNRVYALFQGTNYDCSGIYRTDDAGSNWTSVTVPSAYGMSNFCRGQAWYDLICAVDPNNSSRVFIGGIDILVSTNAGSSWSQKTQWYGGGGYQYCHADQHAMVFEPGSSDVMYYGNDGGIYRSTNASATTPTISGIYDGYNVTQFYACAIHPTAGTDDFLAGAQDNGTQRYTQPGMNNTTEVTGGDGAFCHIDQDAPNIQVSSYVYNNYRVTNNYWSSVSYINYNNNGRFINPTDHDSGTNCLYGAYTGGRYYIMSNVGSGNNSANRSVSAFNGNTVSCVFADPNTADRVWFGLNGSTNIVRVDNASTGSPVGTGFSIPGVSGYVSDIDIEDGDADHLIACFSNYGVNSIWESTNGGTSWTSVEGNMPDMPIRSVMFAPGDASKALVGTELGVWSTDSLAGGATDWASTNGGLANVRVDQLQYRSSDNLMIAATHGRGLFSAPYPAVGLTAEISSSTNVSCFGGNDGSATVSASGGTTPYTYAWSSGGTGSTESGLSAGLVSVTVTDNASNTATANVTITEPTSIQHSIIGTNESSPGASDGSADLTVSGGTPGYLFLWSNGATTEDLSGLSAGTYSVIITDNNACTSYDTVIISANANVTITNQIIDRYDDAEEKLDGGMLRGNTLIELVRKNATTGEQTIGLRFQNLEIPPGATVQSAHIQFTCGRNKNTAGSMNIYTEASDNAASYASAAFNISSRPTSTGNVSWSPPNWTITGEAGANQKTPDLSTIVQEVIDRGGWSSGNALAFVITGTGRRISASYENSTYDAAELVVEYSGGDNILPEVEITSPQDGDVFTNLNPINIDADASDQGGSVTQVEFFVDGGSVGIDNAAPYAVSWTPPSEGVYELTAEVTDDSSATVLSSPVEIRVDFTPPVNVDMQIASSSDDAEEWKTKAVVLTDNVLEIVRLNGTTGNQKIGLRFTGGGIPQGANILSAVLEFVSVSNKSGIRDKFIRGHDHDNSPTFSTTSSDISSRSLTTASVTWTPGAWTTNGTFQSVDISSVIQEIIDRPGYGNGNPISLIITGKNRRDAYSFDNDPSKAAILRVTYDLTTLPELEDEVPEKDESLVVYPNPASDFVYIKSEVDHRDEMANQISTIEVIDANGRLIRVYDWIRAELPTRALDIRNLNTGIHFLRIKHADGRQEIIQWLKI